VTGPRGNAYLLKESGYLNKKRMYLKRRGGGKKKKTWKKKRPQRKGHYNRERRVSSHRKPKEREKKKNGKIQVTSGFLQKKSLKGTYQGCRKIVQKKQMPKV